MCPRKDLDGEGPPRIAGLEARRRPVEPIACAQNRQGGEVAKLQYVNVSLVVLVVEVMLISLNLYPYGADYPLLMHSSVLYPNELN